MLCLPYVRFSKMLAICFFCFSIPISLIGQSTLKKINGKIVDHGNLPVSYAFVSLLSEKDSVQLKITNTDINGNYSFKDIEAKRFLIRVHCLGFKDHYLSIIDTMRNCNIVMLPDEKQLDEVVIDGATKFPIQFQPGKTIVNISENINAIGSDLVECLRKLPGIKIVGEDNILINGKDGVQVYIDGTMVNLKGSDLTSFLKGMPTADIEKLEIISNPSAKYDAEGKGIITIKTKKGTAKGLNGSVTLNINLGRFFPKYNESFSVNYRNKKVNIYGSYTYTFKTAETQTDYFRKQNNAQQFLTTYNQHYEDVTKSQGNNFRTGVDLFLSTKSTLGFLLNGNINAIQDNSQSNTAIYQHISTIDSILGSKNDKNNNNRLLGYNLNYKYIASPEKSLTLDANHTSYHYKSKSYQPNTYTDNGGQIINQKIYNNTSLTSIKINSIKLDYTQKLFNTIFDFGAKASDVRSGNNLDFYDVINNVLITDTGKTNHFNYTEKILAAYVNSSLNYKKWSGRIGLRVENTWGSSNLLSMDNKEIQSVNSSYFRIFPNGYVAYQWTPNHTIAFLYNKRIDRPAYQDLNPFVFIFDELSYSKGNPFLRPQISDNFKLSHIFKKTLTSSISFTNTTDYIFHYRDTLQGKTFGSSINIDRQKVFTVEVSVQHSFYKWWDLFSSLNVSRQAIAGKVGNTPIDMTNNSFNFSSTNTFSFLKSWSVELSGFVNSKYLDAPAIVNTQWAVDIGIQKKILKDAGSLRLSISDIFNSLNFSLSRDFGGLYYTNWNKWESQQLRFSFNYNFGNSNVKPFNEREKGSKDEEKRIK